MLALTAALAFIGQGAARAAVQPTLYVEYTMGCTFTIIDDAGKPVTSIAPGAYQILISTPVPFAALSINPSATDFTACKGSVQFELTGPGVNAKSTLADGDASNALLSVKFQASSTYVAQDNNQPSVARVQFTTLASGAPTSPAAAPSTPAAGAQAATTLPLRGTLAVAVSKAGAVTLTFKGKRVTRTLPAGRYTVSVVDKSKKSGFIIQPLHKSATTVAGTAFVGKRSMTVDLNAGDWLYYPNKVSTITYLNVT